MRKVLTLMPWEMSMNSHTCVQWLADPQSGCQPALCFSSGRHVIVFNGEIYNYKSIREKLIKEKQVQFRTSSDTEVIIEAFQSWGTRMVDLLDGMFALAIYDNQTHELFVLRDRMGKKPLFYFLSDGCFAFASEIKALMEMPQVRSARPLNHHAISHYLHLGYFPEPFTIFQHIFKLKAGHHAKVNASQPFEEVPYWSVANRGFEVVKGNDQAAAKHELRIILENSVKKRLVGDVPIGSFLSGGVDSSLVTAIAGQLMGKPIKTFSLGFKDKQFNESAFARKVASHLGTDHEELLLEEQQAKEILPEYLNYFDEPFADPSSIPMMLISQRARQEVKVVLTGDGGDELFQGYGAYAWANRLAVIPEYTKPLLRFLLSNSRSNRFQRAAHMFEPVPPEGIRSHIASQEQYYFSQNEIRDKLLKDPESFSAFRYQDPSGTASLSPGEKQAIFDLQYYLKDDLLVKVDRSSMYHGLECRCPLLDKELVDFSLRLPLSMKFRNGESKWLLKQLLSDYLPKDLVNRPKWGFGIPVASWLKGDLRYLIDDNLSESRLLETGIFNYHFVTGLVDEFLKGKEYLYNRLWQMIEIQRWLLKNGLSVD